MAKEIWIVRDGILILYERLGECLACGDCCRKFNYKFERSNVQKKRSKGEEIDWHKWEGWAAENWDDEDRWTWWGPFQIIPLDKPKCKLFEPPNHCPKFGQDDWREICRKFPFRPEDLEGLDNCGFSFQRVNSG